MKNLVNLKDMEKVNMGKKIISGYGEIGKHKSFRNFGL
jgi:hypothetical protein